MVCVLHCIQVVLVPLLTDCLLVVLVMLMEVYETSKFVAQNTTWLMKMYDQPNEHAG